MDQIVQWLDRHNVTATTLLITVVLLIAAAIVIFLLKRLLQNWLRGVEARLGLPYEAVLTVTRIASGALWVITVLVVLEIWGIGVGGLWTLLVSAATLVGVGFLATWTMVSNITASLFIMIWRPFRLGDRVEILPENLKGRVVDRDLMFVVLREEAGSAIRIPNNLFFQKMFRVSDSEPSSFETLESMAARTTRNLPP
ncbi:MAG: mechanosensitive ion channel domain-containing protein [Xanthobacteraceae bacterium]